MKLFDFQQETVSRLKDQRSILIGHDMGLGKTVTAITIDLVKRSNFDKPAKTIIICPLAVISSWVKHFREWAPHLNVISIDNKNRKPFMEAMQRTFENPYGVGYDVFIMHYPAMRLEPDVAKYPWFHVICDEVHSLQDRKSSQTKAVKKLQAFYKTGLSGTPVFNKPDDLWSILNWLYPKYWKSYWGYFKRYIKWVEWNGYRTVIGVENEAELQEQMAGFYSRIKKEEVLTDLPNKYFSTRTVKMHPQQARAYKQMKKDMLAWVGEHEHEPVNAPAIIAQLVRLQQFASAYAEVEKTRVFKCTKCDAKYTDKEPGVLVANHLKDCNNLQKNMPEGRYAEDRSTVALAEPSCKIDAVMEIIKESDEPIVVFSQFAQMANLLAQRCEKEGIPCGLYTGSVSKADRDQVVDDFQAGKLKVFAGSIKAGGIGLTLTAASTVVMLNREWAESLNEQAIDRCHRIGQTNAVHVIDVVTEDTIDIERNISIANSWSVIKKLLGEL